jgi:hypothetical protein
MQLVNDEVLGDADGNVDVALPVKPPCRGEPEVGHVVVDYHTLLGVGAIAAEADQLGSSGAQGLAPPPRTPPSPPWSC